MMHETWCVVEHPLNSWYFIPLGISKLFKCDLCLFFTSFACDFWYSEAKKKRIIQYHIHIQSSVITTKESYSTQKMLSYRYHSPVAIIPLTPSLIPVFSVGCRNSSVDTSHHLNRRMEEKIWQKFNLFLAMSIGIRVFWNVSVKSF